MELFNNLPDPTHNLLPHDGIVNYYGKVLPDKLNKHYFNELLQNIQWRHDEAIIFGKRIITKRKVAWYGNKNFAYTYSNTTRQALNWTSTLLDLKAIVEEKTRETYNSCLLNLYHSGDEGVAWHSDAERSLKRNGAIASLSFGAERKFSFKHTQTHEKIHLVLEHGSIMVMKGTTQSHWVHSLPKSKKVMAPRVSLTFRTIVQ